MPADQNYCVLPPNAGTKRRQCSHASRCHRMQLPSIAAVLPCTAQPHSSQLPVSAAVLPMQHAATGAATQSCCSAPHAVRGHSSWLQGLPQYSYAARSHCTYLHCVSAVLAAIAHVTTLLAPFAFNNTHSLPHRCSWQLRLQNPRTTFFGPCKTCCDRPAVLDTVAGFMMPVAAAAYLVQVRACCGLPCWVSCWVSCMHGDAASSRGYAVFNTAGVRLTTLASMCIQVPSLTGLCVCMPCACPD